MKITNTESGVSKSCLGLNFLPQPKGQMVIAPSQFKTSNCLWPFLALLLLAPVVLFAQQYSIDWYKIAGGGGTSTNGQYAVSGTIGQHDAGGPITGGNYSLTGGFWALISVVQQNTNLAQTNGWTTSGYSITTVNGTNSITITPPTGNLFFRLSNP